jgi:hypothetical protein
LSDCQETAFPNRGQHVEVQVQFAAGETISRECLRVTFCAKSREADREAPSVNEDTRLERSHSQT